MQQLAAVISRAEALREEKSHGERQAFIDDIRARAADLGVSIQDLFGGGGGGGRRGGNTGGRQAARGTGGGSGGAGGGQQRRSPAPKYKGPNGETWSGRGRSPRWLSALQAQGHTKDEYLIR